MWIILKRWKGRPETTKRAPLEEYPSKEEAQKAAERLRQEMPGREFALAAQKKDRSVNP